MKAAVLHSIGDLRIENVPAPQPTPGSVLVRVRACGVCGSDIPRIFKKGAYRFPLIPGHEFAGEVVSAGSPAEERYIGLRVVVFPLIPCRRCPPCEVAAYAQCHSYDYLGSRSDGAFAEYVCVPVWNLVTCPEGLSWEEAAMTEPLAVSLHALHQGSLRQGDVVYIAGAGPIGLLTALAALRSGAAKICLSDIDPAKLDFARELGFSAVFDPREIRPEVYIRDECGGADLVIEATGSSAAYEDALPAAKDFARVVLLGNPLDAMPLSQSIYWTILRKELRISGSWNSVYRYHGESEWTQALRLLSSGLQALRLITHQVTLDELPAALHAMRDRDGFFVKTICLP